LRVTESSRSLEAGLRLGVLAKRRRLVVAGGHRFLEPAQLPLGGGQVGRAREDVVAKRGAALRGRPLVVERDAGALRQRELAAVKLGLAVQDPEQGRLAGPVRAGERDAVPATDLERDPVEERVAGQFLAQVRGRDDGHAPKGRGADSQIWCAGGTDASHLRRYARCGWRVELSPPGWGCVRGR
jgi:hypothetical protein